MAIYKLNVTQRSTSEHELLVEVGDKREVEVDAILSEIESQEITSFGEFNTLLEKYGLKIKGFSYGKYYTLGPIKVPEMEEAQNSCG